MGLAVKKTYGYRERSEVKRLKFKEELAAYRPEERVYVDEAGMDNREDYGYGWNQRKNDFMC